MLDTPFTNRRWATDTARLVPAGLVILQGWGNSDIIDLDFFLPNQREFLTSGQRALLA